MALLSTNSTAVKNTNGESPMPTTSTPSQKLSFTKDGITITRIRHHSFHSSTTTRPVTHSEALVSSPYLPHSDAKHVRFASGNPSQADQPGKVRRSLAGNQDDPLSSPTMSKDLSPDKDLDCLADQLLEQLNHIDESLGINNGEMPQIVLDSMPPMSPKPESFVRLRPADRIPGGQFDTQSNSSGSKVTLTAKDPDNQNVQTTSESGLAKLLRRVKGLGSIRLSKSRPTVQLSKDEESLGVILSPPQGSCHFDVQLTLCGLLRRNAANPYELYHFFLENGFFVHLPQPPNYEEWAANYSHAVKYGSPFYSEGVRVGMDGEMDFLRTLFQQWCEAWHDWRLSRPVPESQKPSTSGKLAKWSSKISR